MAGRYTSAYQVMVDAQLYFISRKGGTLTLGMFPEIAQNRWPWLVENFPKYEQRFQTIANGNDSQLQSLNSLKRFVQGYNLGNTNINPFNIERNLIQFRPFLDQIPIAEVGLTPQETKAKDEEMQRAASLVVDDFQDMIDTLEKQYAVFTQEIGLGDETADALYGVSPRRKKRNARIRDLADLAEIDNAISFIEGFIYEQSLSKKRPPNLLAIAQGNLTEDSGFRPRDIYQTYIPIPFEISLEHMASKFLGSKERWFELVTVNNLQPPYIDNTGRKFDLLAPGASNNLVVSSELSDFVAPGVRVGVGSNAIREEQRILEDVVLNEDDTMTLYFGGEQNINRLLPSQEAFVRIYQPRTVRKNSLVLIPSTTPPAAEGSAKPTPTNDDIRRLEKAFIEFGVDVARDDRTRDLLIDSNGNFRLHYGISAVRSAVLNTLRIRVGELPFHPSFGINYNLGQQYVGAIDEAVKIADLIRTSILKDPRLSDVKIMDLGSTDNSSFIRMQVYIKGFDNPIPLAFVS